MAATFDNGFFDFVGTMFMVLAIAGVCLMLLTVGSGLLFTGIHRRLRQARERAGGLNSAELRSSRAGSWLGLTGGLALWLISVVLSRFSSSTEPFSELLLYFSGFPIVTWCMLSGSIAGNRRSVRSACWTGAALFLLAGNPVGFLWSAAKLLVAVEPADQQIVLLWGAVRLLLAATVGMTTGLLAVRTVRPATAASTA